MGSKKRQPQRQAQWPSVWLLLLLVTLCFPTIYSRNGSNDRDKDQEERELQSSPRIIGGDDAVVGRFPYTVSLQSVSNLRHFCGASLIAPDVVLSAAHCSNLPSNMAVRTNAHRLHDPIDASEVLPVSRVVVHPDYATEARIDHDVMVLKLEQPSIQRPLVRVNPTAEVPAVGELLYVMGWGTTIAGQDAPPEVLQFSESFAITNEACVEISLGGDVLGEDYEGDITDDMMCALEEGQGSCQGDSGGPMVVPGAIPEEDVQVGIVSWGFGCALPDYPGVYARVSDAYPFIRQQVCLLSVDPPSYFECEGLATTAPSLSPLAAAPTNPVNVTVQLLLDNYPGETSWKVVDNANGRVVHEVPSRTYLEVAALVLVTLELERGNEYTLRIDDTANDGLCCNYGSGNAFVFYGDTPDYNQVLVHENGLFLGTAEHVFVADPLGVIAFGIPTGAPTVTSSPSVAPTNTPAPSMEQTAVTLVLHFDTYPVQTGWRLSTLDSEVIASVPVGGYGPFVGDSVTTTIMVRLGDSLVLTLLDGGGNGMCCGNGQGYAALYWGSVAQNDRVLVYDDGMFGASRSHSFVASADGIFSLTPAPSAMPTTSPAPSVSFAPTGTPVDVTVEILFDGYANEIGWEIVDAETLATVVEVAFSTYGSDENDQTIRQTVQVEADHTFFFYLKDSFGDGLCCRYGEGYASVYFGSNVDDNLVLAHVPGDFGRLGNRTFVASADQTVDATRPPSASPVSSSTSSPATAVPTQTSLPTGLVSDVTVVIKLDRFPLEVGWSLRSMADDTVIFSAPGGTYSPTPLYSETTIRETLSVPTGTAVVFSIQDSASDGICCGWGEGDIRIYLGAAERERNLLVYDNGEYGAGANHEFVAGPSGLINADNTVGPTASPTTASTSAPTLVPTIETTAAPTRLPTTEFSSNAPSVAPSRNGFSFCFSSQTTVQVQDKGEVPMQELRVGDDVMTRDGRYEKVYSFGHRHPTLRASFVQLFTNQTIKPLEMSGEHMLFLMDGRAVPAAAVRVGDTIQALDAFQQVTVTKIATVVRNGVYAPFTPSGSIAVNGGIVASAFVAFSETSGYLSLGDWLELPISFQWLAWAFEAPHRVVCGHFWHFCKTESYHVDSGISSWVYLPLKASQWLLGQHPVLIGALLIPLMLGLSAMVVMEAIHAQWFSAVVALCLLMAWRSTRLQKCHSRR